MSAIGAKGDIAHGAQQYAPSERGGTWGQLSKFTATRTRARKLNFRACPYLPPLDNEFVV